jgi:hypothetical protein
MQTNVLKQPIERIKRFDTKPIWGSSEGTQRIVKICFFQQESIHLNFILQVFVVFLEPAVETSISYFRHILLEYRVVSKGLYNF